MRTRTLAWVLLGLLAVGLRVYHLGAESIWLDEATSIDTAHDPLRKIPSDAALDVHPPLYYALLHGWVARAGDSERAVRSLSVVLSLGVVLALAICARRWFDERTAFFVALLAAVSPLEIAFAQEARMYALLALTATVSTDTFLRFMRSGSARAGVGYVLATAAMLYTHAYAVFVIAGHVIWLFGTLAASQDAAERQAWLRRGFVGLGLVAIAFAPWLPVLLTQARGVEGAFWIPPIGTIGGALIAQAGSLALAWVLVPLAVFALVAARRAGSATTLCAAVVVTVIGVPWAVSRFSSPIFLAKYTIACSPAFLLLAARGLASVPRSVARAAIAVVIIGLTAMPLRRYFGEPHKDDWRRVANSVEAQALPGDLVIYSQAFGSSPFRYYARRTDLVETLFLDEHHGLTKYAIDVLADAAVRPFDRVWLVMSDPDDATQALLRRLESETRVTTIEGGGVEARLFVR